MSAFPMDGAVAVTLLSMIIAFCMSIVQLLRNVGTKKNVKENDHD